MHRRVVLLAAFAFWPALAALAAPLEETPDTLIEKSRLARESRERTWDPASGQLGNLHVANIVADGCTVRIVSGPDNRLLGPRDGVQVMPRGSHTDGPASYARDVDLKVSANPIAAARGIACLTLQVATVDQILLRGHGAAALFDRVRLPSLRIYLNPSVPLNVWFQDVRIGLLSISSNASASVGGTGEVQWLELDSSQSGTAMFFHEMDARHVGVSTTTTRPRFSIRIGSATEAGYYQPARAAGETARLYPIWIDGPVDALQVPAGHVDAMPITPAIRREAAALRDDVLARVGRAPELAPPRVDADVAPKSTRQQLADALERYLPPGVALTSVELWNAGGALVGTAPDVAAVDALVRALGGMPDITSARLAFTEPAKQGTGFRVLFNLACTAPGTASVCLPGDGGAYSEDQIRAALLPLLGDKVTLTGLKLRGRDLKLDGRGTDADINAALDRIQRQAKWLWGSSSAVGRGDFWATFHLACTRPTPPEGGICRAAR